MASHVPQIFAEERRRARRARAVARAATPGGTARWLGDMLADDALERLRFMRFAGKRRLLSGLGAEQLAQLMAADGADLTVAPALDLEQPLPGGSYDLVVSLAELDTVNDLPGALLHCRRALEPGGLLIASLPGAGSLPVLRQILLAADGPRSAARIHPQIDTRAATALLERAGFARQVVDHHTLTVRYAQLARMIGDLRDFGLSAALADRAPPLTKAMLARAEAAFAGAAGADGRVSEQVEILTMTGWRS